MNKRWIEKRVIVLPTVFVVILLLLGVVPLHVTADNPTQVYVSPVSKTVSAGQTFTINISCIPGQFIKSYEFGVLFNSTLLIANSVSEGNIFNGYETFFNAGTINNTAGTIVDIYGLIVGAGSVSTPGSLVSLSFTAKLASGTSPIGLSEVGVTNETVYVPITVTNGSVILREFTLSITLDGAGSVTKNPNQATYAYGTVVQLTAVPDVGWTFSSWSGNLSGSINPTSITMNGNKSVTAHFTQNQYTLTITVDGSGSVTKNPDQATYTYGQVVTLTAVPGIGWAFSSWTGDLTGSQNPTTITMNGNKAVTAHFTQNQYTLIVTIDGAGSVTKNPNQATYPYGTVVQLTATANTGWTFSSWSGDLSGSTNPTSITMNGNKSVTAHFTQNQYTLTITIDGSGSVTKNPNQTTYTYGQAVTLTAVPGTGWVFSSWSGDLHGSQNPKTITMDGNKSVTAHFTQDQYILTVTIDGSGSVTKNPDQATYPPGTVVQLTATANTGWTFSSWSGDLSGSTNPASITMNGDKSVTAHFTQNQYTLTITVDGSGSVTKNPNQATYTYGQTVTLTAVPGTGWVFNSWTGDLTGSQNPTTITMNGNKAVTAHFTQNQYTLTVTIDGAGSVTKNPNQATYPYGTVVQLTAIANTGWTFSSWSGDLSGSTNPASITMNGNKSVTAHFTQNQYTLTVTVDGAGSVTKNPNQAMYTYGQVVTVTAVPDIGWVFSSWTGDLSGSQNPTTITMNGNKAVTAHFLDNQPPQFSALTRTTSDPLDTDPAYGWVNISCTITDNVAVSQVLLRIHNPGSSWNNVTMTPGAQGNYYYRSPTAFSTVGSYSYSIYAKDSSNNANISSTVLFSMPPNWDINNDGTCAIFDLVLISNQYGETGVNGWIREDADNNGVIEVLDLVYVSNHYAETWWL